MHYPPFLAGLILHSACYSVNCGQIWTPIMAWFRHTYLFKFTAGGRRLTHVEVADSCCILTVYLPGTPTTTPSWKVSDCSQSTQVSHRGHSTVYQNMILRTAQQWQVQIQIRQWTHKRHSIPHSNRWAMRSLLSMFWKKNWSCFKEGLAG